jgi:hypothetical protein
MAYVMGLAEDFSFEQLPLFKLAEAKKGFVLLPRLWRSTSCQTVSHVGMTVNLNLTI